MRRQHNKVHDCIVTIALLPPPMVAKLWRIGVPYVRELRDAVLQPLRPNGVRLAADCWNRLSGEWPRVRSSVTLLLAGMPFSTGRPRYLSTPRLRHTWNLVRFPVAPADNPRLASNRPCWSLRPRRTRAGTLSLRRSVRRRSVSSAMRAECSVDRSTRSSPTDIACMPPLPISSARWECCRRSR